MVFGIANTTLRILVQIISAGLPASAKKCKFTKEIGLETRSSEFFGIRMRDG